MSTTSIRKRAFFFFVLFLIVNLAINLIRQIFTRRKIAARIEQRQETLEELEGKNLELKKKLEFVQSPQFIQEQAEKVLGTPVPKKVLGSRGVSLQSREAVNQVILPAEPNYQKWARLFIY